MKWEQGRQLSEDLKNCLEHVTGTEGMKEFDCPRCEETFASSEESFKDGLCGFCEMETSQENRDSHGLENAED